MSRTHVRVLVKELPPIVVDILQHAIENEAGWELMREPPPIAFERAASRPDLIILGTTHPDDQDGAPALLARWPGSRVLLLTHNGQSASLFELQPRRIDLGEVSPSELVNAIRRAIEPLGPAAGPQRPGNPWSPGA